MATSTLLSDPAKVPTVLTIRDDGGIALSQPGQVIVLDNAELNRLLSVCVLGESTTPAKARLMRYPANIPAGNPATPANT